MAAGCRNQFAIENDMVSLNRMERFWRVAVTHNPYPLYPLRQLDIENNTLSQEPTKHYAHRKAATLIMLIRTWGAFINKSIDFAIHLNTNVCTICHRFWPQFQWLV